MIDPLPSIDHTAQLATSRSNTSTSTISPENSISIRCHHARSINNSISDFRNLQFSVNGNVHWLSSGATVKYNRSVVFPLCYYLITRGKQIFIRKKLKQTPWLIDNFIKNVYSSLSSERYTFLGYFPKIVITFKINHVTLTVVFSPSS